MISKFRGGLKRVLKSNKPYIGKNKWYRKPPPRGVVFVGVGGALECRAGLSGWLGANPTVATVIGTRPFGKGSGWVVAVRALPGVPAAFRMRLLLFINLKRKLL